MRDRVPAWLYLSLLATALFAGFSILMRHRVEARNKRVAIVAEADLVQTLAGAQAITFDAALEKLAAKGLTGVVFSEETVGDLVADGRAVVAPLMVRLTEEDQELRARVARGLTQRFGTFVAPGDATIPTGDLGPALARSTSIGIDPLLSAVVRARKLLIIARLGNPVGATDAYVRESVKWAAESGATVFLAQGEQVLGRRDAMAALADQLAQSGMRYATPEFAKIGGDANAVAAAPENVLRLHAAQAAELDKLTLSGAVERYAKAASERNQRILLLRPVSNAAGKPVDGFGDFVGAVKAQLEREGFALGDPQPFEEPGVSPPIFVAIALSTLPALLWLAVASGVARRWLPAVGIVLAILALSVAIPAGRGPFALLCATAFPILAFVLLDFAPGSIVAGFLRTSAVSLIGGLCVAGLLNGLPFFVKADAFEGVKVAHFLPVLLVGIYFFARQGDPRAGLRSPVFWGQAAAGVLLLGLLAFMAARTGNDNPAGVSGLELRFRALLDQWLVVRPRTKEFLLGHPALIVLAGMLAPGRTRHSWLPVLAMAAAVGQTSMVNTLCHLHTPIALSLIRVLVGLVLGGIIGAMVWGVSNRFAARHAS